MKKSLLFFIFCLVSNLIFAQEKNFIKHTVVKGETISLIAAKYRVTPFDIYRINPDAKTGVKENDVILIPNSDNVKIDKNVNSTITLNRKHIAKSKENLYSISRDYDVDVSELKSLNEEGLKEGLKIGQVLKIPNSKNETKVNVQKEIVLEQPKPVEVKIENASTDKTTYHIVAVKETKFGIAKKYGISVEELEQKNPEIVSNLPIGYKLLITGIASKKEIKKEIIEKPKPVVYEVPITKTETTEVVRTIKKNGFANYEVKPKETLFSLTQSIGVTEEELIFLNPTLKDGLKEGMILKVPGKGSIVKVQNDANVNSTPVKTSNVPNIPKTTNIPKANNFNNANFPDLTKTVQNGVKKQLVLLLPFNASKIQADTIKTIGTRLKKDAFLNMTLDFYSGVLMAIDSAKTLGLNIDVKILDSEESKLSSNVINLVNDNNLQNVDAVIGPFYQQYVEKVAELLNDKNVPVISPLSKEIGKSYGNLYQAMPPSDFAKSAMFDYMKSKNGNIIIVNDPRKVVNRDFITKKYPESQFVAFTEKGSLDLENLQSLLVKDKMNYVVLDSEKTGMILGTTNKLLNELSNFQIQLVIIEQNETLDFDEISMKRLTILKMLYPSLTRENYSVGASAFEKEYKEKNKIFPSQYAIRGFDVTLDTMLRLSQNKTFEALANDTKTEQVESKFEYVKKDSNGYSNKGVYIMQYEEDLSVKQVN